MVVQRVIFNVLGDLDKVILSPFYLFVICVEGFSDLARKERLGLPKGISLGNGVASVNHFLFMNDSFIFSKATVSNCNQVASTLTAYELNLQKSKVCFSRNVKRQKNLRLVVAIEVNCVDKHECHMGLPTIVGHNRRFCFRFIKEMTTRLEGETS